MQRVGIPYIGATYTIVDRKHNHTGRTNTVQFEFRTAQLTDFEVVASLFEQLHTHNAELDSYFALSPEWRGLLHHRFLESYTDPEVLWLLAWQAQQPAGLLILKTHVDSPLYQHRNWTELVAIYIAPAYRGTGLATELITHAREWTTGHGLSRLQLYVTATNDQARLFYQRCGLHPVQEIWRLDVELPPAAIPQVEHEVEDLDDVLEPGHPYLSDEKRRG